MKTFPAVTKEIRWHQLFGNKNSEMSEQTRRLRWDEWLTLADKSAREYWTDTSACENCIHLDGNWCKNAGLPATVNPYLTIKHGRGIGMACMGVGFEKLSQQEMAIHP